VDLIQVARQLFALHFQATWLKVAGRSIRGIASVMLLVFLGREIQMARHLDFAAALHAIHTSPIGSILFAPARLFANMALATGYGTFVYLGLAGGSIVGLILAAIIWLESGSQSELGESEVHEIPKKRSKAGTRSEAGWGPRWWNGIGPIFWRQILTLRRKFAFYSYAPMLLVIEGSFVMIRHISGEVPSMEAAILAGTIGLSGTFVMTTGFDFRAELDQMEVLKGLPLSAVSIVLSEMLPLVAVGTLLNLVHLILLGLLFYGPRMELLEASLVVPSVLLLLVAFENLAFLLFPLRIKPAKASGFGEANRTLALLILKMSVFTCFVVLFAGAGWYLRMNGITSNTLFFLTSFVSVTIAGVLMCCGVVAAFQRFDVATDIPG
jgi:hypothetical protein